MVLFYETMKPSFRSSFISEVLGISPTGNFSETFRSVTTDSRTCQPEDLFVALKGDAFDGHSFIGEVLRKGVSGVVCHPSFVPKPPPPEVAFFPTENTLSAYRKIAAAWRGEFQCPVLCVAGSVGKTTTKEFLAAILRGKYREVLKTESSQNGFVGIPLTLLRMTSNHQAAVVEVGIDAPGAMREHLELLRPTASVVTTIAEEHLEMLGTLEIVAKEESEALSWVGRAGGLVAINADDPWLKNLAGRAWKNKVIYGFISDSVALRGEWQAQEQSLLVTGLGLNRVAFRVPLPGAHNAANLLSALSLAAGLGLTEAQIKKGLQTFTSLFGRSDVIRLSQGGTVLCDFYNANPASMRAGFSLLQELYDRRQDPSTKMWACLGDMRELGAGEIKFHQDLAEPLLKLPLAGVFLFGPCMEHLAKELKRKKVSAFHFSQKEKLIEQLLSVLKGGDTLLIKGSRGMKMEDVYKAVQHYFSAL
jgi:UDP-N-acetylmuramoyl-tripeptide--D-alanyl-D-alanine ligase